jgi:stage II sporulation protein D
VVNLASLEDYLRGLVPAEMPSSSHHRACARRRAPRRSYALATARRDGIFDQYASRHSQVDQGVAGEEPRTDAARAATAGRVVVHDGAAATTFFHSTSGGRTESSATLSGAAHCYLKSADDPEDRISPHHR